MLPLPAAVDDGAKRSPNASAVAPLLPVLAMDCGGGGCGVVCRPMVFVVVDRVESDGVIGREPPLAGGPKPVPYRGVEVPEPGVEPDPARRAKTSGLAVVVDLCCGDEEERAEERVWGLGFAGAEADQRSAKESDMGGFWGEDVYQGPGIRRSAVDVQCKLQSKRDALCWKI
jgi:hypothetical protein